jgi:transaldolase
VELFIDSADITEVQAALDMGLVEGITTTPTFMHRLGIHDIDGAIADLSGMANQFHIEALGDTCEEVVAEASRVTSIPNLIKEPVFKIPVSNEGLKAASKLTKAGHQVNVHLVYTLNQAYLAAVAGATYICPLVGRLQDQGHDSFALIEQAVKMVERYKYSSKIMVSSVRNPEHVRLALLSGAHAVTVPWGVMRAMATNALTDLGITQFNVDTTLLRRTVGDLVRPANPVVNESSSISEAAIEMTTSKLGAVSVVDADGRLVGILTDGDLRRAIDSTGLPNQQVDDLMTRNPKRVESSMVLQDAVDFIRQVQLDSLVVVDDESRPLGIFDVQDLLREGLIKAD